MNNSLITMESVDVMTRVSKAMVASGYFKDAHDVAQAFVKIQAGAEMGLPPFASMTGIHIIQGKPTLGANVLATLIKQDGRYNYRVLELTPAICRIQFYEDGEKCGVSQFTAKDATKAGTKNMNKFPKNMLFARAISNGAKWYAPGIFGGAPIYTPEELGASVDEGGDIIDAEPESHGPKWTEHVEPEPEPPSEPLPDDEQVIYEVSAAEWMVTVIALIDRYDNAPHVANTLKQLGYSGVPKGNGDNAIKRLNMYRALKAQAQKRDDEDAEDEVKDKEPPPLFDEPSEPTGAYAD